MHILGLIKTQKSMDHHESSAVDPLIAENHYRKHGMSNEDRKNKRFEFLSH